MLLTALVALPLPERQILGSGLDLIGETIASNFALPLQLMAGLVILEVLATSLTIGSGNSGGVFAPSLFIGAARKRELPGSDCCPKMKGWSSWKWKFRPGNRVKVFVGFADEEELRLCLLGRPQAKDQARFE